MLVGDLPVSDNLLDAGYVLWYNPADSNNGGSGLSETQPGMRLFLQKPQAGEDGLIPKWKPDIKNARKFFSHGAALAALVDITTICVDEEEAKLIRSPHIAWAQADQWAVTRDL